MQEVRFKESIATQEQRERIAHLESQTQQLHEITWLVLPQLALKDLEDNGASRDILRWIHMSRALENRIQPKQKIFQPIRWAKQELR